MSGNDQSTRWNERSLHFLRTIVESANGSAEHFDYEKVAWLMAASTSAEYMVSHLLDVPNCGDRVPLLDLAIKHCTVDGLVLEFGVYTGNSLETIARLSGQDVHGFDSFEGLPEDWTYFQKKGRFSLNSAVPKFSQKGIHIHQGLFSDSLPGFLAGHAQPARFVHIDCDLYHSTVTVLDLLQPRLVPGTIIVFDEYLNYPGWQYHEFKAFQEFIEKTKFAYRYIGYASNYYAVAIEITSTDAK